MTLAGPAKRVPTIKELARIIRSTNNPWEAEAAANAMLRRAKDHCSQGHVYSHINSRGQHCCRICQHAIQARSRAKRKEALNAIARTQA
jgi:hypothetical protein